MTTNCVVADGMNGKRKPTPEEHELFFGTRLPELVSRFVSGGVDPTGVNATIKQISDGAIITASREVVIASPKPKKEKFRLIADLGIITIPEGCLHETRLDSFRARYKDKELRSSYLYSNDLTDANFPRTSRILKPGDKLWVRAFEQTTSGKTTATERMKFLDSQNAVYTGAQGVSHVWEQKRDQLPKGKYCVSYDKQENLWWDPNGDHRVPYVSTGPNDGFRFGLIRFGRDWDSIDVLLCFCELPAGEA